MRNLIPLLLAFVVLSSGCDPDGYSCNLEGCYVDDNNPQFQTLEDCNSLCDEAQEPGSCGSPILHDGYIYSTVLIGDQCWFSENCRYLPSVSSSSVGSETSPYYYVYGYQGTVIESITLLDVEEAQATANYATYGVLYNWPAVMTEGICPSGWHIPSDGEWTQLTDFLGGEGVAGGKMKEAGYDHWNSPNEGATNSSGFTGLPSGLRYSGGFSPYGNFGGWWSTSESGSESWSRSLSNVTDYVTRYDYYRNDGFSARCVRD